MAEDQVDAELLVAGGGMAGLAAARALAASGISVMLLEAQPRIGGRILTRRVGGEVIELGAEFVHGRPSQLLTLIEEAGLTLVEREGSTVHYRGGKLTSDEDDDGDAPFSLLEKLEGWSGRDLSFAEFLDSSEVAERHKDAAVGFVEGFNAADHRVISAQALGLQQQAEDAIEGDRSFHVEGGYDQLPNFLAKKLEELGGEMRLDARLIRIEWQPGRVLAQTNQGSFTSRKIVIALPLGVFQGGAVKFMPQLPQRVGEILTRNGPIRMGSALRFTMIFRERFWEQLAPQPAMSELSFLIGSETLPRVWWTSYPEKGNTLTGWVGGPQTAKLSGLSADALGERSCNSLAEIFGLEAEHLRSLLTGCFMHDWSADPYSQGAYSYIARDGLNAPGVLTEPISETLYFAGEHTATDGHWGTVHAALGSGLRAAGQIVAAKR